MDPAAATAEGNGRRESGLSHRVVALAGNPNVGKTSIFNRLTGLRQKVGNYPGVTVERKSGFLSGPGDQPVQVIDVPGLYSLNPASLDEEIACRVLSGRLDGEPAPDLVVVIVDASSLERNLYLVSQVLDLGVPTLVALNMVDEAEASGQTVDAERLGHELGIPVIPTVGSRGAGIDALKAAISGPLPVPPARPWSLHPAVEDKVSALAGRLVDEDPGLTAPQRFSQALRLLTNQDGQVGDGEWSEGFRSFLEETRQELDAAGVPWRQAEVVARYGYLTPLVQRVVARPDGSRKSLSDRLDAVLTHRIAGPVIFLAILALIFQSVFAWAVPFMDTIDAATAACGDWIRASLPAGPVRELLVDGVIAGVGAVVVFLPQILILFFFLGLLESTGYMARAAFIMDRIMKRVGLSGRSVVPLLSSFACAIPGIMAARTIDNQRDRLVTILVAPLMTCSARLPVYTLLIGAFIPPTRVFGFLGAQGLTLFLLYLLGILFAILAAWVIKRFVVRGEESLFVMELPPYRLSLMRDVLWRMVERSRLFLTRAGTVILSISIVLWFLASYPQADPLPETDARTAAELATLEGQHQLSQSVVGRLGKLVEPVIRPLGYDWKIGVALISSLAAREVAVSALATIYSVGDVDETSESLRERMRSDIDPRTGEHVFTPLVAVSLMIFYVLACQCMSTVAIVRRETGSWRWPLFLMGYMTALAWVAAFVTFQGGRLLGF
jgi:ferrous iron transport protein B